MKQWGLRAPLAVMAALLALCVSSAVALGDVREDQPTPIARGPHISGVAQVTAHQPAAAHRGRDKSRRRGRCHACAEGGPPPWEMAAYALRRTAAIAAWP